MQMIKFISCPDNLIEKDILRETITYCLGYKDRSSKEKEIMRKKEEEFIFAVSRETNQDV